MEVRKTDFAEKWSLYESAGYTRGDAQTGKGRNGTHSVRNRGNFRDTHLAYGRLRFRMNSASKHIGFAPLSDTNQLVRTPDGVQEPLPEKDYAGLVRALCRPDDESEWVEFKRNFGNPKDIGKYIAALANSAALNEQPYGYLLWGVEDGSGVLVGTSFDPHSAKKSNEPLKNWLLRLMRWIGSHTSRCCGCPPR